MATKVRSFREQIASVDRGILMLKSVRKRFSDIDQFIKEQESVGFKTLQETHIIVEGMLGGLITMIGTDLPALMTDGPSSPTAETWGRSISPNSFRDKGYLTGFAFDKDAKTITVVGLGTDVFTDSVNAPATGDIIRITNAEDPTNDVLFTLTGTPSGVLLTSAAADLQVTNAKDTTAVLTFYHDTTL